MDKDARKYLQGTLDSVHKTLSLSLSLFSLNAWELSYLSFLL